MCDNRRSGGSRITNPDWGADADSYYHRQRKAPDIQADKRAGGPIGKLYTPDGRVKTVEAPKEPFGFNRE